MSDTPQTLSLPQAAEALAKRRSETPQAAEAPAQRAPQVSPQEDAPVVGSPGEAVEDTESDDALDDSQLDDDQELSEEDDGDTVEDGDDADEDQEPLFTVKVDGKEVEVGLDELRDGYMRERTFTKKTMDLADQRKAVESAQSQQASAQEANLSVMQAIVESLAGSPVPAPDPNLFHTNRAAYDEAKHAHDQWRDQATQWHGAVQQYGQQFQQTKQAAIQQKVTEEIPHLAKAWALPANDVQGVVGKVTELQSFLQQDYGIPAKAFESILDHQVYLAFEDAKKWRDLKAGGNSKARQKMKRQGIKPIRGGKANVRPKKVSQGDMAQQRFEQAATAQRTGGGLLSDAMGAGAEALAARKAGRNRRG